LLKKKREGFLLKEILSITLDILVLELINYDLEVGTKL